MAAQSGIINETQYTTVIGLEIHAELLTNTKLFCGCPNTFGRVENENICPGCLGLPGTLPALNRAAVELAIKGGLALGCTISKLTSWDRKNYFYADLPNGYQITQMFAPICIGGGVDISGRYIRLDHIHLEEDAGKLIHDNLRNKTRVDYNRGGVPLIEIVTKPDMRSAAEAVEFIEKVRLALIYAGVCDGRMEQGRFRVDANISVMPTGADEFGVRTEVKNLNSFRFVALAIEHEVRRHIQTLENGGTLRQETRRFIEHSGETASMREKEDAADYRYFPDSDIPSLVLDDAYIESLRASMPEPPESRKTRYIENHHMAVSDAETILARKSASDFYDGLVALGAAPRDALGIVRGEILRHIGERDDDDSIGISVGDAAQLLRMCAAGEISANNMKKVIGIMMREAGEATLDGAGEATLDGEGEATLDGEGEASGVATRTGAEVDSHRRLDEIIKAENMLIREDPQLLQAVVRDVLAANPIAVASYKSGEDKVIGFFMGQCNKTLKGSIQPKTLQSELRAQLEKL